MRKITFLAVTMIATGVFAAPPPAASQTQTIPNAEHIQYWMKTLESHPLIIIRKQAARQLGNLQNQMAIPSLIKGLSDVNDDVRIQSAYSLGRLGDASALKPLYEMVEKNSNTQVQAAGRNAIDKINAHEEFAKQRKQKLKEMELKNSTSPKQ